MRSIRLRLFIALLATFVVAWIVTLFYLGMQFNQERNGLWDRNLRDVADEILLSMPSDIRRSTSVDNLQLVNAPTLSENLSTFSFQVWVKPRRELAIRSVGASASPLKPDFNDGFSLRMIDGREWRIYAVSDARNEVQVQVGKPTSELAAELHLWIRIGLGTTLLLLLLLGLVIRRVIEWSLRPVTKLERAITQRDTLDLDPLPGEGLPAEVRPLVESFNQLLHRVDRAVKGERQFLTEAAHELRTPLAALLTNAQVALRARNTDDVKHSLEQLVRSAERSARLAQQLLDSARLDVERREAEQGPVELADIVSMVTREFEVHALAKRQSIMLEAEPCLIYGNVDDLGILVGNLIDNALRYTSITGRVQVSCLRDKDHVHLAVRDNGPGIDASESERIFERFYRIVGTNERGSGIGLSLVARIAKSHGATIETGSGLYERGFGVMVTFPALKDVIEAR